MATVSGAQVSIPGFKIYGGTSASSAEDANHTVFYANCGSYKPNDNRFGLYLFKITRDKIKNIPLTPFPESRGVLVADVWGLNLTTTLGGTGGKFQRYKILDYVMPAAGGQVLTGEAADTAARNAIAALEKRVGRLESEEAADDKRDAADDARDADQTARLAKLERQVAELLARPQGGLTIDAVKNFLWNDRFLIDLIYDLLINRKDGGLIGAIKAAIRG